MARIVVLGASGTLGRRIVPHLAAVGHDLVLVGRARSTLEEQARATGDAVTSVRVLATGAGDDPLLAALRGVDLAVSALPVTDGIAGRVLAVAARGAVHLVDTVDVQAHLRTAYDDLDAIARASGTVIVPGVGWRTAVGDLLTAVAAARVVAPRDVHVAAVVPDRGGVLGTASPGVLRGLASSLGRPTIVVEHGERREELPGEVRRLAWFPRPFGPHHAVGYPGMEPLSVPRHVSGVGTVRSYVAASGAGAELLQAVAALAERPVVRRRVAAALERRAARGQRDGNRWAVVAEVAGGGAPEPATSGAGDVPGEVADLARAWANGRDHLDASARLVSALVGSILAGDATPGVVPPALAGSARDLLDAVAADSDVRWSVSDPRRR